MYNWSKSRWMRHESHLTTREPPGRRRSHDKNNINFFSFLFFFFHERSWSYLLSLPQRLEKIGQLRIVQLDKLFLFASIRCRNLQLQKQQRFSNTRNFIRGNRKLQNKVIQHLDLESYPE